jgi:hypothetical protein
MDYKVFPVESQFSSALEEKRVYKGGFRRSFFLPVPGSPIFKTGEQNR